MFLVPRKRIWTQQPQSLTGIDWRNSLTKDLRWLYEAASGRELAGGKPVFRLANYAQKISPGGLALSEEATAGIYTERFSATPNQSELTLFCYAYCAGLYNNSNTIKLVGPGGYTGLSLEGYAGGSQFSAKVYQYPDYTGTVSATSAKAQFVAGQLVAVAMTYRRNDRLVLYVNGNEIISTVAPDADAGLWAGGSNVTMGGSQKCSLQVLYGSAYTRALSAGEIKTLSDNPWQLFKAPDSRIFVPVGAGGVTNDSLTADSITTASASVGSPLLTQNHALTGSAITAYSTLSSPTLAQNHSITGAAISTAAATLSTPALSSAASNYALTATAISTAAATLSAPALAQNHIITASGITTSQPTLSAPTISGDAYNLTATGIATAAPTLSQPNLAQNHALTGGAIAAGSPVFSTPTLAQQHALLAMGITTGSPTLSTPVLSDGSLPTYTSAPHGRGYRRDMADTIRPKQRNTTRP